MITKQSETHSWAVYHVNGTPAELVGIIDNAPDEQTAIARAVEEYEVPPSERGRLISLQRDQAMLRDGAKQAASVGMRTDTPQSAAKIWNPVLE